MIPVLYGDCYAGGLMFPISNTDTFKINYFATL